MRTCILCRYTFTNECTYWSLDTLRRHSFYFFRNYMMRGQTDLAPIFVCNSVMVKYKCAVENPCAKVPLYIVIYLTEVTHWFTIKRYIQLWILLRMTLSLSLPTFNPFLFPYISRLPLFLISMCCASVKIIPFTVTRACLSLSVARSIVRVVTYNNSNSIIIKVFEFR